MICKNATIFNRTVVIFVDFDLPVQRIDGLLGRSFSRLFAPVRTVVRAAEKSEARQARAP